MKRLMQFRYYGEGNDNINYPYNHLSFLDKLVSGILCNVYSSISQLGIQGPPGLIFYLNNSGNKLTIGKTGIYELDLAGIGRIFAIQFDGKQMREFKDRLIIDIVYEGG